VISTIPANMARGVIVCARRPKWHQCGTRRRMPESKRDISNRGAS